MIEELLSMAYLIVEKNDPEGLNADQRFIFIFNDTFDLSTLPEKYSHKRIHIRNENKFLKILEEGFKGSTSHVVLYGTYEFKNLKLIRNCLSQLAKQKMFIIVHLSPEMLEDYDKTLNEKEETNAES